MQRLFFIPCSLYFFQVLGVEPVHSFANKNNNSITFQENKGQVSDQYYKPRPDILYTVADKGMLVHLKNNGISYQLFNIEKQEIKKHVNSREFLLKNRNLDVAPLNINTYRIDVYWLNTNANVQIQNGKAVDEYTNYYLQSCPDGATNVMSYNNVTYKNIYDGIDLIYYSKDDHLKYDYVVQPNTDYKKIQFQIKGAQKISVNKSGELVINTPMGEIVEGIPLVIQNGKKLKANWQIINRILDSENQTIVSFNITGINKNESFTIDPLVRFWGTYCGSTGIDHYESSSTDSNNNLLAYGYTQSPTTTLIATVGSHQTTYGGNSDVYLAKYNSFGVRLWSTYYGGSGNESPGSSGNSCVVDFQNNIYICGIATSTLAIATAGSHQTSLSGTQDAFLSKFNSSGIRQWGTYYGGLQIEDGRSCAVDQLGNVFFAGTSASSNGTSIATAGSHQSTFGGGMTGTIGDGFLVKFNTLGVRQWGTYYGGINDEYGLCTTTDLLGNSYLCGISGSNPIGVIATSGAHQTTSGGTSNSYLVKFNPSGVRLWGTYYGGNPGSSPWSCVTDGSNNIYMAGGTYNGPGNTIATVGCHQSVFGGLDDGYLVKFNAGGQRLWGTFYGAYALEYVICSFVDANKNVYISGISMSNSLDTIASLGSYQYNFGGGSQDAYLAKFDSLGTRKWGTYYGGNSDECSYSCCVSKQGHIYLLGFANSYTNSIIATPGSQQFTNGGNKDGFIAQFFDCGVQVDATITAKNNGCFGLNNGSATLTPSGGGVYTYTWLPSGGNTNTVSNLAPGNYTCIVHSICGNTSQTLSIIQPTSSVSSTVAVSNTLICLGNSSSLTVIAIGGTAPYTYSWSSGATSSITIESPTLTTNYSVTISDANGCSNTKTITQVVAPLPIFNIVSNDSTICRGETATLTVNGPNSYTWSTGGFSTTEVVSPTVTTTYSVNGVDNNGCSNTAIFTQSVGVCLSVGNNKSNFSNINVFPNPSMGVFYLTGNTDQNKLEVEVIDAIGRQIYRANFDKESNLIDISNKAKGVYLLKIYQLGIIVSTKKIFIE